MLFHTDFYAENKDWKYFMLTKLPIGNLEGWRQIFTDDFDVDVPLGSFPEAVADKWRAYPSPWKNQRGTGTGTYSPQDVVSIKDGILTKHIHTENGVHMIAAILPNTPGNDRYGQMYGRYALCWRSDKLPGYKIAWLLWPDTSLKLEDGEVDWPEMNLDQSVVWGYVHRIDGQPQSWCSVPIDINEWHTTVIEWSPDLIVFTLDGREIFRSDQGIPNTPMHWVIQTETELSPSPAPDDNVAGGIQIAWVAAWQYDTTAKAPEKLRTITLVAPATAIGNVPMSITASTDITEVKWVIDGIEVKQDGSRPFSFIWDSTKWANGVHNVMIKGRGAWWFNGPTRTIRVSNPWKLIAPATATGTITLGVTPYSWYKGVKWVVGNQEIGSDVFVPISTTMQWDSTKLPNGTYEIYAKINNPLIGGWIDGPKQQIIVAN